MTVKTLTINGKPVSATEDQTLLDVVRENEIPLPTLCYLDGLSDVGACRLCLVEVEGQRKLLPACTARVEEGMVVRTDTPRLQSYRRMIVELLFAERNHVCSVCVSNGHCDLQQLGYAVGMDHVRFPHKSPNLPVDATHDRFLLDHNRCVLCTRCVRVCDEIEGAHTWDIAGRGAASRVITDLNQSWGNSETCTSCGKCVQVCPTGTLFEKGKLATDIAKNPRFLTYIRTAREQKLWIK
jgi:bidirectional [NiFe] hydrogenase diaphorase subunit